MVTFTSLNSETCRLLSSVYETEEADKHKRSSELHVRLWSGNDEVIRRSSRVGNWLLAAGNVQYWSRTEVLRAAMSSLRVSYLTLRLLISYIYGAPSKARNANVVYIWTYV